MTKKQKRMLRRILIALAIYLPLMVATRVFPLEPILGDRAVLVELVLFAVPYLIAGYDVLQKGFRGIFNGRVMDENFLMSVATLGAFALVLFPDAEQHFEEGAAVMLFYQVGEFFQSYAVGKTRRSIADMMDIAPEFAIVIREGETVEVDPAEVAVGDRLLVRPGDRVPLDGVVLAGSSALDTSALTGESVPRQVAEGDQLVSGCINLTGRLEMRATKEYGQSAVSRILELVENASEKKARTENFVTRFARVYTPIVVLAALLLALIPPLAGFGSWSMWIQRGLTFLVVSCPCALVISVPLSFFAGIGGASRRGVLVKGSNYLEVLAKCDTVAFDKTGTLTSGKFAVVEVQPAEGESADHLLCLAAHAEASSTHPIAISIGEAYGKEIDASRIGKMEERGGYGISAEVDGHRVLVGNARMMQQARIAVGDAPRSNTALYIAADEKYLGCILIADAVKPHSQQTIDKLHDAGVKRVVMLTGDREDVARNVSEQLGVDEYRAQLLPQNKVECIESIMESSPDAKLAFVGDGINDAPVLMRADVGIAMGAMGSDAAIEAADVVLMDDDPQGVAVAIQVARKTMRIVWQNIVFAIGVKVAIMLLAAVGIANMWLAVFGDVGVAVLAILNAMRCMNIARSRG